MTKEAQHLAAAALDALALDLRLQPGIALGPFTLGIPLWHTLDYLRSNPAHFPKVHVVLPSSSSKSSSNKKGQSISADGGEQAIVISILPHLHLIFSARSQRLQLITFNLTTSPSGRDPSYRPIRIAYTRSLVFDSTPSLDSSSLNRHHQPPSTTTTTTPLTRTTIHQTFGPTYSPRKIPDQDEYVVSYPGLAFTFPATAESSSSADTTTTAPDKHTPASAFHIFAGHDLLKPAHVLLPPASSHMLPTYGAASGTSSSTQQTGIGPSSAGGVPTTLSANVPPACLKAVIRPGHSLTLHLFSHAPSQPFSLSSQTTLLPPTPLLQSIFAESSTQQYPHGTRTLTLTLGTTTTQDVLATLGAPQRRFEKVDERLGIHSFAAGRGRAEGTKKAEGSVVELARRRIWTGMQAGGAVGDFVEGEDTDEMYDNPIFWNYFDLGLDLLFSSPALTPAAATAGGNASGANTVQPASASANAGAGGVLLKVIVHSNVPGSALFQRYNRCPWVVVPPLVSGKEVSFHEHIDELATLLSSHPTRKTASASEDRIELDRASDADFIPPSARSKRLPATNTTTSDPPSSSSSKASGGVGTGTPLRLDVRTWLYGFENGAGREEGEGEDVPEGGLIAEADEAGRVCSVLIY
ncbi:hypothetical protein CF319_g7752 [Tilletia indica]|nr:hypothetical protein CF319_g7752 [Tilletia indica]